MMNGFFQMVADAQLDLDSTASLAAAQKHWHTISSHFSNYQCVAAGEAERQLSDKLPEIAESFDAIVDALLEERRHMFSLQAVHQPQPWATPRQSPVVQPPTTSATAAMTQMRRSKETSENSWSPGRESASSIMNFLSARTQYLPPTYYYFFGTPPDDATEHSFDDGVAGSTAVSYETTVGPTFLLTLCQYAKLNHLAVAQQIIFRFFTRLLHEADIPVHHLSSGSSVRSILQLNPSASIVPVLDMIWRVGSTLDPTYRHHYGDHRASGAMSASASDLFSDSGAGDSQRTAFVVFLCALAETTERVPAVANFFVTEVRRTEKWHRFEQRSPKDAAAVEGVDPRPQECFVLLDVLLPYLTHDCTSAGWESRRETCRYALGAVLSLAKCPDPWVQSLVAAEKSITHRTLGGACTTLLTLCKIPSNDDGAVGLAYLRDVMRFWSGLCLSAPTVAHALSIPAAVEDDFAGTTMTSLFTSSDSHVYSGACLVLSHLLKDLNSSAPVVARAMTRALVASVIDPTTGRVVPKQDFYEVALQVQVAEQLNSAYLSPSLRATSFLNVYILSKLTVQPVLSEEDYLNSATLDIPLTEWTATESTLALLRTLTECVPYTFMKYALLLDMNSIMDVRYNNTAVADTLTDLSVTSSAPAIELAECFPESLRTPDSIVCGISREKIGEEVLERLLRIESNVPVRCLQRRQRAVNAACVPWGTPQAERITPEMTTSKGFSTPSSEMPCRNAQNLWFTPNVNRAPVIQAVCELLRSAFSLPYRVRVLVMDLVTCLCLQPDLRVLYTILDPNLGCLHEALGKIKGLVESGLAANERIFFPKGSSSAAQHRSTTDSHPTGGSYLYQMYVRHWRSLPTPVLHAPDNSYDTRAAVSSEPITDELMKALVRHQAFFETCAAVELLRLELHAVVGCVELSHKLLTLRPGEDFTSHSGGSTTVGSS